MVRAILVTAIVVTASLLAVFVDFYDAMDILCGRVGVRMACIAPPTGPRTYPVGDPRNHPDFYDPIDTPDDTSEVIPRGRGGVGTGDPEPPQAQAQPPVAKEEKPPQSVIENPRWIEQPRPEDYTRHYPPRALSRGIEGRVMLECVVTETGRIGCAVESETPAGERFGRAALKISRSFRMSPRLIDGKPAAGGTVRVPINFRIQDECPRRRRHCAAGP